MLTALDVENYRALQQEKLALAPLTVFVGENSSGKSTALQVILLALRGNIHSIGKHDTYLNLLTMALTNPLSLDMPASSAIRIQITATRDGHKVTDETTWEYGEKRLTLSDGPSFFPDIVYLSADRIGPQATYLVSQSDSIGIRGENAIQYLDRHKNNVVSDALLHPDAPDQTLLGQTNYWLRHIVDTSVKTEGSSSSTYVEAKYSHGRPDADVSPLQTGFGTSSVMPVVLACLSVRPGGLLLLENPEIHLHPRAQARLAELFAFVAKAGVQILVETHCEHLVYKLCHLVYQNQLSPEQLLFHYKEKVNTPFATIHVNERGRFVDQTGKPGGFPSGFFDATLQDYLAMYM